MRLILDISDDALTELHFGREELRREAKKELALAFYARGFVSLGKAVEIAETSRMQFEWWLVDRKIERPFSEEEMAREIAWAGGQASDAGPDLQ